MKIVQSLMTACAPLALCACALSTPAPKIDALVPAQWQAAGVPGTPHNGSVTDLAGWWQGQGDPLLARLIDAAQAASPSVSAARARIAQSRAERVAAGAAQLPSLDAAAAVSRSNVQSALPAGTTSQAAFQAAWEVDLFGARAAGSRAAAERLAGAQAGWHEARVSVAAETANQYYALRACALLLAVAEQDAASRADTARLTRLSADAGFQSPATAALARASAAEGRGRATQQRALCDVDVKALVALTAVPEPELRASLASVPAVPAQAIDIASLPARVLAQRPDVFSAEREVAAASADVGVAEAQRYPRLALQGSVGAANLRSGGVNTTIDTWTIGPLALTVPIFDGGRRRADADAARARYDNAAVAYRAVARGAVREVEEALVNLRSSAARTDDAQVALDGFRYAFRATEDLYKNGLASLLDLEETRRNRLGAEITVVVLERERNAARIALYRAAGGGWHAGAADVNN